MMDYALLQQFVTFYRTGTLRETAEKLHISQPTLTRNMQKLEATFGIPLFIRSRNSIALNEAGLIAAEDAELVLKQVEAMFRRAREFDRASRTISIGTCTPIHLPELIRNVTDTAPAAVISSETLNSPQLLEGLRNGTYLFVFLPFHPEGDDLYCKKWGRNTCPFCFPSSTDLPVGNPCVFPR